MRTRIAIALGIWAMAPRPGVASGASARLDATVRVVRSLRVQEASVLVTGKVLDDARARGSVVVDPRGAALPVAMSLPTETTPGVIWITVLADGGATAQGRCSATLVVGAGDGVGDAGTVTCSPLPRRSESPGPDGDGEHADGSELDPGPAISQVPGPPTAALMP